MGTQLLWVAQQPRDYAASPASMVQEWSLPAACSGVCLCPYRPMSVLIDYCPANAFGYTPNLKWSVVPSTCMCVCMHTNIVVV